MNMENNSENFKNAVGDARAIGAQLNKASTNSLGTRPKEMLEVEGGSETERPSN